MVKVLDLLNEQKEALEGQEFDYLIAFDILDKFFDRDEGYIDDALRDACEDEIDIYNHQLLEWLRDNVGVFETYIEENGIEGGFDLYRKIQEAQFDYYYHDIVLNNENNFIFAYKYNFILNVLGIDEITEEQEESIDAIIEEFDDLGDIINEIKFRLGLTKGE